MLPAANPVRISSTGVTFFNLPCLHALLQTYILAAKTDAAAGVQLLCQS